MQKKTGVDLLLSDQTVVVILHLLPLLRGRGEDGLEDLELLLVDSLVAVLVQHGEGDLEAREGFDEDGEEEEVLGVGDDPPVPEGPEHVVRVLPDVRGTRLHPGQVSVSQIPPLQPRLGFRLHDGLEEVLGSHVDPAPVLNTGELDEPLLPAGQLPLLQLLPPGLQAHHPPGARHGELAGVDDGVDEGGATQEAGQGEGESPGGVGERLEPGDWRRQQ